MAGFWVTRNQGLDYHIVINNPGTYRLPHSDSHAWPGSTLRRQASVVPSHPYELPSESNSFEIDAENQAK